MVERDEGIRKTERGQAKRPTPSKQCFYTACSQSIRGCLFRPQVNELNSVRKEHSRYGFKGWKQSFLGLAKLAENRRPLCGGYGPVQTDYSHSRDSRKRRCSRKAPRRTKRMTLQCKQMSGCDGTMKVE